MSSNEEALACDSDRPLTLHGHSLLDAIVGTRSISEVAFLELTGEFPTQDQLAVFDSLLVTLVDHGVTASGVTARLTDFGAPGAMQGAVAAGLLGIGDRLLGSMEGAAKMLQAHSDTISSPNAIATVAAMEVERARAAGHVIPGLGHRFYRSADPRVRRLVDFAADHQLDGAFVKLIQAISDTASEVYGRRLIVNVTGIVGALASELGIPWHATRGIGLIARAVGLVGQLVDERRAPRADAILRALQQEPHHR